MHLERDGDRLRLAATRFELQVLYGSMVEGWAAVGRKEAPTLLGADIDDVEELLGEVRRLIHAAGGENGAGLPSRFVDLRRRDVCFDVTPRELGVFYHCVHVALQRVEAWEYQSRTGWEKGDARKLLHTLSQMLDEVHRLDGAAEDRQSL